MLGAAVNTSDALYIQMLTDGKFTALATTS